MVGGRRDDGFTLIELMIVVAIIGILAAIAVPKFASPIRKASEGSFDDGGGWLYDAVNGDVNEGNVWVNRTPTDIKASIGTTY